MLSLCTTLRWDRGSEFHRKLSPRSTQYTPSHSSTISFFVQKCKNLLNLSKFKIRQILPKIPGNGAAGWRWTAEAWVAPWDAVSSAKASALVERWGVSNRKPWFFSQMSKLYRARSRLYRSQNFQDFSSKYAFERSRRDLHSASICITPKTHVFQNKC